jgi:PhnB protein
MTVRAQPGRVPAITPYLSVRGAAAAIDFYRRAFGAEELYRLDAATDWWGTPRSASATP